MHFWTMLEWTLSRVSVCTYTITYLKIAHFHHRTAQALVKLSFITRVQDIFELGARNLKSSMYSTMWDFLDSGLTFFAIMCNRVVA